MLIVRRGKMPMSMPSSTHGFSIPSMCFIARVSYISCSARSPPGKAYPADYGYIQSCIQIGTYFRYVVLVWGSKREIRLSRLIRHVYPSTAASFPDECLLVVCV